MQRIDHKNEWALGNTSPELKIMPMESLKLLKVWFWY